MKKQHFRVSNLSGMDETLYPPAGSAEVVFNMTVDDDGIWTACGGWTPVFSQFTGGSAGTNPFQDVIFLNTFAMHYFAKAQGGQQWIMLEYQSSLLGTCLAYVDFGGRAYQTIETSRSKPSEGWRQTVFLDVNNWVYVINGVDAPKRWNGIYTAMLEAGFSKTPPAPLLVHPQNSFVQETNLDNQFRYYSSVRNTTDWFSYGGYVGTTEDVQAVPTEYGVGSVTALVAPGGATWGESPSPSWFTYVYAVQWINDLGQLSAVSERTIVSAYNINYALVGNFEKGYATQRAIVNAYVSKQSVILEMPEAPANVRGFKLYRSKNIYGVDSTVAANVALYEHSTYDSGTRTIMVDSKADDQLGGILDESQFGEWPQEANVMAVFKNTMFLGGFSGNQSTVRYSAPLYLEQFPEANELVIGDATTGRVTGFTVTLNTLVVFKERGIFLVKGDPVSGFQVETFSETVGCRGARLMCTVPDKGLAFLNDDGIYLLIGALTFADPTRVTKISQRLDKTWEERVNLANLDRGFGIFREEEGEVWFHVPADGSMEPNLGLVWHYRANAWSLRHESWPFNAMVVAGSGRNQTFGACSDITSNNGAVKGIAFIGGKWPANMGWDQSSGGGTVPAYTANPRHVYETNFISFGDYYDRSLILQVQPLLVGGAGVIDFYYCRDGIEPAYIFANATDQLLSDLTVIDTESRPGFPRWDYGPPNGVAATWGVANYWGTNYPYQKVIDIRQNAFTFKIGFQQSQAQRKFRLGAFDIVLANRGGPTDIQKLDSNLTAGTP